MADLIYLSSCPVCRAKFSGEEPPGAPCRRCGSDLETLRQVYTLARYQQSLARYYLAHGRNREAWRTASEAVSLVDNQETRKTLAASLAANGWVREATLALRK